MFLFQNRETTNSILSNICCVDDILIGCADINKIEEVAYHLEKKFELTKLGMVKNYLGIKIEKDKNCDYYISQETYIETITERFGLNDAKISKIPLDTRCFKLVKNKKGMNTNNKFQQLIGALLYVSTHTRPDITASVSILSQRIKNSTETDWNEAKKIIRYLKGTKNLKLKTGNNETGLVVYFDADWAEYRSDSKSHSGYILKYNGSVIAWACRKQTCVAWSSCEAEYIALA